MNSKFPVAAIGAWLLVAAYYFYQYALRSAPSVMMPELTNAFGVNALGVSAIVGMFYYGYSPFSLVAGVAMDRLGPRAIVPIGAATVGVGALLFASGNGTAASPVRAYRSRSSRGTSIWPNCPRGRASRATSQPRAADG